MNDVEDVLRETLRAHEWMAGNAGGLAEAATALARGRRRRRLALTAVSASVVAVSAGVALAVTAVTGPTTRPRQPATTAAAPSGWRWESSLGVEIAVPRDWLVNDYGCGATAASSVVRGQGVVTACLSPEPRTKQVAIIAGDVPGLFLPGVGPVDVRAHPSGTVRLPDGRYAGWRWLAGRGVTVSARTRSAALTARILASAHPVDVDSNGCATRQPAPSRHGRGDLATQLVPGHPTSLAVCWYPDLSDQPARLLTASWLATGAQLDRLVAALNAATSGSNPDRPGCKPPRGADAVILARYRDGSTTALTMTINGCRRGIDNGPRQAHLTVHLIGELTGPLHTGFGVDSDIPRQ